MKIKRRLTGRPTLLAITAIAPDTMRARPGWRIADIACLRGILEPEERSSEALSAALPGTASLVVATAPLAPSPAQPLEQ
ncbi:hypothetical protein GGR40_001788 [Novosphingobium gossypii]